MVARLRKAPDALRLPHPGSPHEPRGIEAALSGGLAGGDTLAAGTAQMSVRVMSRPTGVKWRRNMFALLCERDGPHCSECGAHNRTIWRNMGYGCGEKWGSDPWETHRYTIVYPTSNLEVDHRVALHNGGDNTPENLWLLCVGCHKTKTSAERSRRLKALFAEARA